MVSRVATLPSHVRALSSPPPREKQRLAGNAPRVYAGWLFVEVHNKRAFAWRYCVLDSDRFQVYTHQVSLRELTTTAVQAALVREHHLVHVERMHRLNRGLLLVDREAYGLWVHGTPDEAYFEQWLAILQDAVLNQSVRLTISRYGFEHQSSNRAIDTGVASTGWLKLRRVMIRGWVVGPTRRLYCVLSGRHFSAFKINMEGRWADLYGKIERLTLTKKSHWLELTLESGVTVQIAAKTEDATGVWELRIQAALRREPYGGSARAALVTRGQSLHAPRRVLTY